MSVLFTLGSALVTADHLPPQSVLRIGGAEYGSGINRNAVKLAQVYHRESVASRAIDSHEHKFGVAMSSAGSIANLRDLITGRLEFGYVHAGLAERILEDPSLYGLDQSVSRLRLVAALQPSVVHIIASTKNDKNTVDRLQGKRISYGMRDTGNRQTIDQLLTLHGIKTEELEVFHYPLAVGVKKLAAGDIDAIVAIDQVPNAMIADLLSGGEYQLLSLNIQRLQSVLKPDLPDQFRLLTQSPYAKDDTPFVGISLETLLISQDTVSPTIVGPVFEHLLAATNGDLSGSTAKDPLQAIKLSGINSSIPLHDACTQKMPQTLSSDITGVTKQPEKSTLVDSGEH